MAKFRTTQKPWHGLTGRPPGYPPHPSVSNVEVEPEVARLILRLEENLKNQFGDDFAYTIMGRGSIVAASNARDGHVFPRSGTHEEESE